MKHDIAHEKRQDEMIGHLADAILALTTSNVAHAIKLATHVKAVLAADETEPAK